MHLYVTDGTIFAGFQIAHNAHFTKGVKTFNDRRGIDEISTAQHAHQVRVELRDLYPSRTMHFVNREVAVLMVRLEIGDSLGE